VLMPKCDVESNAATNQPCWHIATDTANCPNSDHLTLKIEKDKAMDKLPTDSHVIANCVTEVTNN